MTETAPSPAEPVLLVDDDEAFRSVYTSLLREEGYAVTTAVDEPSAIAALERQRPRVVVLDLMLPPRGTPEAGAAVLDRALALAPDTKVIVASGSGEASLALSLVRRGAYDFLAKPVDPDVLSAVLARAVARLRLEDRVKELESAVATKNAEASGLLGASPAFVEARTLAERAAVTAVPVLVTGESGTGKELVARHIHAKSPRAKGPFVAVNCGAPAPQLLESTLFGHKKGAFTGAVADAPGLFVEADGGTLFLDEIGDLPLGLQVKLLRTLQEGTIRRVGENTDRKVDVRVVAASLRDLTKEAKANRFREDLLFRLNVLTLVIPPLRARKEDIPLLVDHFVARFNERLGTEITGVDPQAMRLLCDYPWPGNVRELEHAMERAMVLCEGTALQPHDFEGKIREPSDPIAAELEKGNYSIKKTTRTIEEILIRRALEKTKGNRTRAAELLEISHRALLYKIKEFGIT